MTRHKVYKKSLEILKEPVFWTQLSSQTRKIQSLPKNQKDKNKLTKIIEKV